MDSTHTDRGNAQVASIERYPAPHELNRYNNLMECPKCKSQARDTARFCPRCHATLRYECPSCHHQQTHGGTCDRCGIDFLKYLGAIVAGKKAEADMVHDRIEQRTMMIKNIFYTPFTLGIPLIRDLLVGSKKSHR
jgi:hypothetical protein